LDSLMRSGLLPSSYQITHLGQSRSVSQDLSVFMIYVSFKKFNFELVWPILDFFTNLKRFLFFGHLCALVLRISSILNKFVKVGNLIRWLLESSWKVYLFFIFINGLNRSRAKRKGCHRKMIFLTNRGTWGEHFPLWKYLSRVYIFLRNTNDSFISLSWSNAFPATRKPILNVMFLKIILQIRKKAFRKIKYHFCFWSYIICYDFLDSLLSYIRLTYKTGYM